MVRQGSLSDLRTTFCCIAIAAATVTLVATAPPAFAADPAFASYPVREFASPNGITRGPDGAMWFTQTGSVARMDATGSVFEFPLPDPSSSPTAIATGPDGNLWFTFTVDTGDVIGRLTPAGGFLSYPLPVEGSSPAGITAGPDGAMWFTERSGNRIGRIDVASGAITEHQLPGSTGPNGITVGPDGAVWFTELSASKLGRIDPATGAISHISLPPSSGPTGVAADDDSLWVTLRGSHQVARVTPAGNVTLFAVPTALGRPTAITDDPAHDRLWFVEANASAVVRLRPNGAMEEFLADASAGLQGIAADAAGRPWFTESRLDRIGMLDLPAAPPDTTPPTIAIQAPEAGAWTVLGAGALAAGYTCADEGGSGVAVCAGTVADGAAVPDGLLGTASLDVHAEDVAGNGADASAPYLVFGSASGSVLDPTPARPGEGLTLELGMGLASKASPLASAATTSVSCATGEALGASEPADVRVRVTNLGELSLRWVTSRAWTGRCRTLTLSFSDAAWTGADAIFGPVTFPAAKR